ncbi:MAG: PfkB family carbohydrate kinase [Acidobacteria bacterium]|nr:PfkB family carbohydrate kinase [Acidobacteriota bacterium]
MINLSDIIREKFTEKKIVIIGDLVADQFLYGTIARVSREAPVFILRHDETKTLAGAAANAAVNVASLGGKATLIGIVGKDRNGEALLEKLCQSKVNCDYVVVSEKYQTTTKVRVLAGQHYAPRQQVIRIDYENFPKATTATPNQEEVEQILGKDFTQKDCVNLCQKLGFQSLLVTRGNKGMLLIEKDKSPVQFEAIGAKEPIDVTGAGDTVIAAYALGLASGLNFSDAANLANHAGGIVVMKKGTASVSSEELIESLSKYAKVEHKTQTIQRTQ